MVRDFLRYIEKKNFFCAKIRKLFDYYMNSNNKNIRDFEIQFFVSNFVVTCIPFYAPLLCFKYAIKNHVDRKLFSLRPSTM